MKYIRGEKAIEGGRVGRKEPKMTGRSNRQGKRRRPKAAKGQPKREAVARGRKPVAQRRGSQKGKQGQAAGMGQVQPVL